MPGSYPLFRSRVTSLFLSLLISIPNAHARECFENGFNEVVCSGLSDGARIGIAIAILVVATILLVALTYWRRRRLRERNLVYITNPNVAYPPGYNPQGQPYNPPSGYYPQYPPQAYAEQPYNGYTAPFTGANGGHYPQYSSHGPGQGTPSVATKQ